MNETILKSKRGLNIFVVMAILYAAVVLQPSFLYLQLMTGTMLASGLAYFTILIFSELAKSMKTPLSSKEIMIIYFTTVVATSGSYGLGAIQNLFILATVRAYWVSSPLSKAFGLEIPNWFAPPATSQAILSRTLFHIDWFLPFSIFITGVLLQNIMDLSLGLIFSHLYVKVERLPFPLQQVDASAINTLSKRDPDKMRLFSITFFAGLIIGLIVYGIPSIFQALFGITTALIPLPWADMTSFIEPYFPGAMLGISTDIFSFTLGFIIPFHVVVSQFIGSFAIYFIGNYVALKMPLDIFKGWQSAWLQGMDIIFLFQYSFMHIWVSVVIGLGIGVAIVPIITENKRLLAAFKGMAHVGRSPETERYFSLIPLLLIFAGSGLALIFLNHYLVPGFPLWLLLSVTIGFNFIYSMINARSLGMTGYSITIPYLEQGVLTMSGYPGMDKWFMMYTTSPRGGAWVAYSKVCELTGTDIRDLIKAFAIALPLGWLMSLIYTNAFWQMAPIPSGAYPYTSFSYPLELIQLGQWASGRILTFNPWLIIGPMLGITAAGVTVHYLHIPFSIVGFLTGASMPIPVPLSTLTGALLGKFLFKRFLGPERWEQDKLAIVAGLAIGVGTITAITSVMPMIAKAAINVPY